MGYLKLDFRKDVGGGEGKGSMPAAPTMPKAGGETKKPLTLPAAPASKHSKTVLAHGILLTIGFLIALPIGVLTGRWGRTFTPIWFKVHWILNWPIALPAIAVGWCLGPIAVNQHDGPHFSDPHKVSLPTSLSIFLPSSRKQSSLIVIYLHHLDLGNLHRLHLPRPNPHRPTHPPETSRTAPPNPG